MPSASLRGNWLQTQWNYDDVGVGGGSGGSGCFGGVSHDSGDGGPDDMITMVGLVIIKMVGLAIMIIIKTLALCSGEEK